MNKREMTAGEIVESLHRELADVRAALDRIDGEIGTHQTEQQYWLGRKDAIVEAIGVVERGVSA